MNIQKCRKKDLNVLNKCLPMVKNKHQWRFDIQKQNKGAYLIAWQNNRPVGCLVLLFEGVDIAKIKNILPTCPDINYLYIHEDYRKRGIATSLIKEACEICVKNGYRQIGLLVDKNNKLAIELYISFGFKNSNFGGFPGINITLKNGKEIRKREVAEYWIKDFS